MWYLLSVYYTLCSIIYILDNIFVLFMSHIIYYANYYKYLHVQSDVFYDLRNIQNFFKGDGAA